MSVVPMRFLNIAGNVSVFDKVAQIVGSSELFHPENAVSFYKHDSLYTQMNEENPYAPLMEKIRTLIPDIESGETAEKCDLTVSEMEQKTEVFCEQLGALANKRASVEKEICGKRELADKLQYFANLGVDLPELSELEFTEARLGRIPNENFRRLNKRAAKDGVEPFVSSADGEYTYLAVFYPSDHAPQAERLLEGLHFETTVTKDEIAGTSQYDDCRTADEICTDLRDAVSTSEHLIEQCKDEEKQYYDAHRDEMCAIYEALQEKSTYSGMRRYAAVSGDTFLLVGWVPAKSGKALVASLEKIEGVEVMSSDALTEKANNPPIMLKNNFAARPFEMYVGMYGMPSYGGFDPTPFVAFTYTLLFGIMFADVGQGLFVALAGFLLWKFKQLAVGKILVPCGICSALFGLIFGSVFGFEHALDPMYKSLFGLAEKPIEVMKPATTNMIIYAAVGIGFALVVCAMLINIVICIKQKDAGHLFFGSNGLPGLVFYVAVVAGLVCQMFLNIPIMNAAYIICFIALPLVLMFLAEPLGNLVTGKKEKIEWGNYLAQSFFELFETLLSYVTNTMSFLRVGAFVLVHAGMMTVVFTLAEMSSGAGYIAVVIIGNVIISVLEALLVSIQVLRLEYYEMFSRFFDGAGRPFEPITIHK